MDTRAMLEEHMEVMRRVEAALGGEIGRAVEACRASLRSGGTLFFMGNGGSAADSQHLAAEFVGRFHNERRSLPAMALTTDTSILTAVGNDYTFDYIFARQVESLVHKGDVVFGISTSGNSRNVIRAVETAREKGAVTVGFLGKDGGQLRKLCDISLVIPSETTARIQEAHITIGHIICSQLDEE